MTNIIVGQNISGSLTTTSPTIVDPTSPFNGQFYDDFDVSSVNVIDPSNLPFLLAASKEFGDIGSVNIGETRSTNIFVQPPAGSAPGAITTIQLINTKTNSVDAQATSSSSEALKFVKNAEIVGSDYKIRVINATPGDYQISLAGAIQSVLVTGGNQPIPTPEIMLVPPVVAVSPDTQIKTAVIDPIASTQPNPILVDEILPVVPDAAKTKPITTLPGDVAPTVFMSAVSPELIPTAVIDPIASTETTPIRGVDPQPNERVVSEPVVDDSTTTSTIEPDAGEIILLTESVPKTELNDGGSTTDPTIDPTIDPTLIGIDPVIFQNAVNNIPLLEPVAAIGSGPLESTFKSIVLNNNFLSTTIATGFGISAVSQKAGGKVSEIGIFAVDDTTGKIGGIAPGAPGYLKAIGDSARSIFSTLGGSFFDSSSKREIALEPNKIYGFFEVPDGSIADLKQQLISGKIPTNILSSLADDKGNVPIKVTNNSTTGGYNVSVNNDELVLSVVKLDGATPNVAIGAKSQGLAEGRTIDLTGLTGSFKADITTKSSAAYNNNVGFYVVEDSIGTIKLANGTTVKPGDINYAVEAVKSALANSLQAGKTDSKLGQDITGGLIYAPVVVSQGSLSDFIATNPANIGGSSNNAYVNYVLGNSDKQDHFRLIGENTFGVEDQLGGGDRDFNDLVVNMNVKPA
jgi:Domain of unknown function (DUF4114)